MEQQQSQEDRLKNLTFNLNGKDYKYSNAQMSKNRWFINSMTLRTNWANLILSLIKLMRKISVHRYVD